MSKASVSIILTLLLSLPTGCSAAEKRSGAEKRQESLVAPEKDYPLFEHLQTRPEERCLPNCPAGRCYLECTGSPRRYPICPQESDGWAINLYRGRGGLEIGATGGDNYHSELWGDTNYCREHCSGKSDCFVLYCARNQGRGSNSWAHACTWQVRR